MLSPRYVRARECRYRPRYDIREILLPNQSKNCALLALGLFHRLRLTVIRGVWRASSRISPPGGGVRDGGAMRARLIRANRAGFPAVPVGGSLGGAGVAAG